MASSGLRIGLAFSLQVRCNPRSCLSSHPARFVLSKRQSPLWMELRLHLVTSWGWAAHLTHLNKAGLLWADCAWLHSAALQVSLPDACDVASSCRSKDVNCTLRKTPNQESHQPRGSRAMHIENPVKYHANPKVNGPQRSEAGMAAS